MKNNQKGFTLIEVLVGIVITGLLIISFSQVLYIVHKSTSISNNYYLAINWSQSLLEILKSSEYKLVSGEFSSTEILTKSKTENLAEKFPSQITSDTKIKINKLLSSKDKEIDLYHFQVICKWKIGTEFKTYKMETYFYI